MRDARPPPPPRGLQVLLVQAPGALRDRLAALLAEVDGVGQVDLAASVDAAADALLAGGHGAVVIDLSGGGPWLATLGLVGALAPQALVVAVATEVEQELTSRALARGAVALYPIPSGLPALAARLGEAAGRLRAEVAEADAWSEQRGRVPEVACGRAEWCGALERLGVGLLSLDRHGGVEQASAAAARMVGRPAAWLVGLPLAALAAAEDQPEVARLVAALATGEAASAEVALRRPAGATAWVHLRAVGAPAPGASGRWFTAVALAASRAPQVLAQREEAFGQLAASLRLRTAALEAAGEAVVLARVDGVIEWVNPAFTALTGYRADQAVGRTPAFLQSGETPVERYRELWATITSGRTWRGELVNRRADGSRYVEALTIAPVAGPDGAAAHFVAVKRDLTTERRLRDELDRAQRVEALGQLAGSLAHDLNNVLVPILAGLGPLAEAPLGAEAREALAEVEDGARRAQALVRQVLDFARGEAPTRELVDTAGLLGRAVQAVRAALGPGALLEAAWPDQLWAVRGDPVALEQVLLNLGVNARDAAWPGLPAQVRLTARDLHLDRSEAALLGLAAGAYVELAVADAGTGIAPNLLCKVFEPFFTTKPVGRGTGLGLATVRRIVRAHAGAVTVESDLGRGSTFRVLLPAAGSLAAAEIAPSPRAADRAAPGKGVLPAVAVLSMTGG
ncbi:MAG: PAS domain S-box protein [Anaeromyxobacter sp.]|nr:PAS domain S-box protein [Anaeromyxobacter sp.]MBL0278668.1 PAS domain S-box protein [Anaeromyxobacter sp.]